MANRIEILRASEGHTMAPFWRPFASTAMIACANGHVAMVSPEDHLIADDGDIAVADLSYRGSGWREMRLASGSRRPGRMG